MALPQGINFRQTSGYVSDPTGTDYEIYASSPGNYPRTSAQGNTVGWESTAGDSGFTRNRNSSNDARLAGLSNPNTGSYFRIDLPSTGSYNIRAAFGDGSYSANVDFAFRDDSTSFATVSGSTGAANSFYDASGTVRTAAAWPGSNSSISRTFTSTIFRLYMTTKGPVAHLYVESASGGGSVSLAVADMAHAQATDGTTLTVQSMLSIADAAHAQLTDNLTLQAGALLAVADATHAHSLGAPTLTTQQLLAIADALHAQYADSVMLSNAPFLAIQDATHAQVADAFALSVQALLAVQDMQHAQTADGVALGVVGEVTLAIQNLLHSQVADMVTFASGLVRAAIASRTYLRMTGAGHRPAQRSTARRH